MEKEIIFTREEINQLRDDLRYLNASDSPAVVLDGSLKVIARSTLFMDFIKASGVKRGANGKFLYTILPDLDKYTNSLKSAIYETKEFQAEAWLKIGSNNLFLKIKAIPMKMDEKKVMILYLVDKTSQEINKKERERLLANKERFFSILIHDLKGPFSAILGFAELLKVSDLSDLDRLRELIDLSYKSTKKGFEVLEDIIEWYKISSGDLKCYPKKENLSYLVNSVVADHELSARSKGIKLMTMIDVEISINSDINMFKSVLRNLLVNSIKFSSKGDVTTVRCHIIDNNFVEVSVIDTGIGIPDYMSKKIFSLDEKIISRSGTNNEQGTGFGLLNSKMLVELCGGKIALESTEGTGSIFKFTVPLAK